MTKPRPSLKHTHSLEIPGLDGDEATVPIQPQEDDELLFELATNAEGLFENLPQHDEMWLPAVAETCTGELDELIATSLRPNLPKTSSNQPASKSPCTRRPQGLKKRISRKEQIQTLRSTVRELSERKEGLITTSRAMASAPCSPASSAANREVATILAQPQSLWERVATRQLKRRCEAEEENAKLKSLVAEQKRRAKNLRRQIRRRVDDKLLEEQRSKKRPKRDNDEQVFEKLLEGVDAAYTGLEDPREDNDSASVPCPGRQCRLDPSATDGAVFVTFVDKNRVPFDFARAERAVWRFLQGPRVRDGARVCSKDFQQSADTSKSCVGFLCTEKGLASYVLEQRVARKYVEKDRTVFVSRMLAEPSLDEGTSPRMRFCETMRVVVKPGLPFASGQKTAVIESHLAVARYVEGTEDAAWEHWPAYVKVAANGWDRKVSFNRQQIENLLFDDVTCSRKST